jgi:hypothetical protein
MENILPHHHDHVFAAIEKYLETYRKLHDKENKSRYLFMIREKPLQKENYLRLIIRRFSKTFKIEIKNATTTLKEIHETLSNDEEV